MYYRKRKTQSYLLIVLLVSIIVVSVLVYFSLGHGTQVQTGSTGETTSFKAGLPSINRKP
jgi:hypothetical protein